MIFTNIKPTFGFQSITVSQNKETIDSLLQKGFEVYEKDKLLAFCNTLLQSSSLDVFEKGHKDLNKLQKKVITDHDGVQRTVWVKTQEDPKKEHATKTPAPQKWIHAGTDERGNKILEKNPEYEKKVQEEAKKVIYSKMKDLGLDPSDVKDSEKQPATDNRSTVDAIVNHPSMKKSDKVRALFDAGVQDKKELSTLTGAHYSQVLGILKTHTPGSTNTQNIHSVKEQTQAALNNAPLPSVEDRWDSYEMFADMVTGGVSKSLIAFGTGGVGKTFTVNQSLKDQNLILFDPDKDHKLGDDQYDAVKITGKASASAIYQALFEHNGKLIMFDDCDSALKDEDAVNLFKGALDTSGDGTISYGGGRGGNMRTEADHGIPVDKKGNRIPDPLKGGGKSSFDDDDMDGEEMAKRIIPNRFKFSGRVIFISNLSPKDMPQPLVDSRSLAVDLSMTTDQTIERMRMIVDKMPIESASGEPLEVSSEDRHAIVDFIDEHKNQIRSGKLNARTIGNLAKIKVMADKKGVDWKKQATVMLYS